MIILAILALFMWKRNFRREIQANVRVLVPNEAVHDKEAFFTISMIIGHYFQLHKSYGLLSTLIMLKLKENLRFNKKDRRAFQVYGERE
jgi:hypothetical protein